MDDVIWVLADNRAGNANQAIGLAEASGEKFIIKNLKYNLFSYLPNFLLGQNEFYINKSSSDDLSPPFPKLVISSGRRTAPLALSIKQKSPSTKIIQIMKPHIAEEKFDLIILPQHDTFEGNSGNIYRTVGAMNRITPQSLKSHQQKFREHYPQLSLKVISVMIGGSNKRYKFTRKDAEQMVKIIEQLSINHAAQLFISFSRRTPEAVKEAFYNNFSYPNHIYDPAKGGYNPYFGMLAASDFIITTGDSISMCSDVATAGKPQYIYVPPSFTSPKHNYFVQQLIDMEVARRLLPTTEVLSNFKYKPLAEARKAAKFIKEYILN
ncbi:MAG: putative nucleoside-diphosphate-sugar epimerase [Rickettsiaceae bacterium]|jgi:mitochondrial fission protein ELM1|nr:putative nucleoside-diphosphate-sugar epimerase [Rickettsiaceae bacterium]